LNCGYSERINGTGHTVGVSTPQCTIRILGPVDHCRPERVVPVRGKAAALLTVLALHANRPVTLDFLTEALRPRPGATNLGGYARTLRDAGIDLDDHDGGYVLRLETASCDYLRFGELVARANAASPPEAVGLLEDALELWRGDGAAQGVARHGPLGELLDNVDEQRMRAVENLAEARIALGEAGRAARELSVLLSRSPLRDRAWWLRIHAHHELGEYAAMAASYQAAFRVFRSELGRPPSAQLTDLYRSLVLGG
jgi:hypothetical protein